MYLGSQSGAVYRIDNSIFTNKDPHSIAVHDVLSMQDYLYLLTLESRVLRLLTRSIWSANSEDIECMDLPSLSALAPIVGESRTEGFYGLTLDGQILAFPATLTQRAQSKLTVSARDDIAGVLLEMDKLSDRVRRLETECQRSTLSRTGQVAPVGMQLMDTLLDVRAETIVRRVSASKQFYIRLQLISQANIDWSQGWSVVIKITSKGNEYLSGSMSKREQHHQVVCSLADFSRHSPWVTEVNIDLQNSLLPLTTTLGLQYNEQDKQSQNRFVTHFIIERLELDAIHFAEPVPQQVRAQYAEYNQATSRADLTPLELDIDTEEIQMTQCLPALLSDCISQDRIMAFVQSSIRACLSVPEECFLRNETNAVVPAKASFVWLVLEEKEKSGSMVKACIHVRGPDPQRVRLVHQAVQRRIDMLFG
ncbi:hypothetical protein BG011_010096 [Mortierella polycephala]|uniref:Uncharacterized protein n=1 Tax=Mortierella polycephala TaxID=41804 RepID=A0A9P6QBX1_9FUNG|nr:hypothetical protein BG011_010096 [Mortierella polycephala]